MRRSREEGGGDADAGGDILAVGPPEQLADVRRHVLQDGQARTDPPTCHAASSTNTNTADANAPEEGGRAGLLGRVVVVQEVRLGRRSSIHFGHLTLGVENESSAPAVVIAIVVVAIAVITCIVTRRLPRSLPPLLMAIATAAIVASAQVGDVPAAAISQQGGQPPVVGQVGQVGPARLVRPEDARRRRTRVEDLGRRSCSCAGSAGGRGAMAAAGSIDPAQGGSGDVGGDVLDDALLLLLLLTPLLLLALLLPIAVVHRSCWRRAAAAIVGFGGSTTALAGIVEHA